MDHILSTVVLTPLVGFLILLLIPSEKTKLIKLFSNGVMLVGFLVSLPLVFQFDPGKDFQFVEDLPWIPSLGATWSLGIDGYALLLVMLTTLTGFLSTLCSWSAIETRLKEYYACFLVLQVGMLGVFMAGTCCCSSCSGNWCWCRCTSSSPSGAARAARYAAIKFMLYTLVGSILMLIGILTVYYFTSRAVPAVQFRWARFCRPGFRREPNGGCSGRSSWALP